MIAFKNSYIYIGGDKIKKTNLIIKGNKFFSFKLDKNAISLPEKYIIVPGFIEEHVHGASNEDCMCPTQKAIDTIANSLLKDGTTSFLPTTMTMAKQDIINALKNIAKKKRKENEAKILGIHLEGPFISKIFKGAQDEKYILKPNIKIMEEFINASDKKIKLITIAPEEMNEEFLKYLKKNKIIISAGHSNTSFLITDKAINNGYITCTTHTYNAMSKLHHRDIGLVGAALLHKDIYSELILDLEHVSAPAAKLLLSNKGKDKLILITDSMEARNMPDGTYKLGTFPVYKKDGRATLKDGTLAGSILKMNDALKNAKKVFNLKIEEIIDLVTVNVANNLHLKKIGSIKKGYFADFTIIDKDFNIYQTYVDGKLVYSKDEFKL